MIGTDIARALDRTMIAAECGIHLDDWQADLMRSDSPRILLNCARQTGKSTTTSLIALSTALFQPAALVLLVSPSQRQSAELFRTTLGFYRRLKHVPTLTQESVLRAEFAGGSRIVALPGDEKTVRGYAGASLVVIDEAARVDDALIAAVRPMLATSNGRLIALSTPFGKRGFFFSAWTGHDSWHRVEVPASACPRISAEFLEEELRELGQQRYSEEYQLCWLDPTAAVFPTALIDAAFSNDVRPLW